MAWLKQLLFEVRTRSKVVVGSLFGMNYNLVITLEKKNPRDISLTGEIPRGNGLWIFPLISFNYGAIYPMCQDN